MKSDIKHIIGILFLSIFFAQESYSLDTKCSVGTIGGTVDISALGAATYQIPIDVAPGIAGIQPSLSLVYSSQTGNSIAGWGFNISGLSAITRVPRTIYTDGIPYGVENRYFDGLSLDGNRLIPLSGTSGYDGAEFHTETETFMKIVQHGTFGNNGANWFEVTTKDGIVFHYGCRTGKIKFNHNGKKSVEEWLLDEVKYPNGKTINYEYEQSDLVAYIKQITYGKQIIKFYYDTRTDAIPVHFARVAGSINKILRKIVTQNAGATYRQYDLEYSLDNYSRLTKVTESNGAGETYNPTIFEWGTPPSKSVKTMNVSVTPTVVGFKDQSYVAADVNGDGLTDIVGYFNYTQTRDNTSYTPFCAHQYLASLDNNGNAQFKSSHPTRGGDDNISSVSMLCSNYPDGYSYDNFCGGSGTDVLFVGYSDNKFLFSAVGEHFTGRGTSTFSTSLEASSELPAYSTGDINNDGKSEIVYLEKGKNSKGYYPGKIISFDANGNPSFVKFYLKSYTTSTPQQLYLEDFDGDGLKDLLVLNAKGYTIYYNQGESFSSMYTSQVNALFWSSGSGFNSTNPFIQIGDFNGDGLPDIIVGKRYSIVTKWYLFLNTGTGGFKTVNLPEINQFLIAEESYTSGNDDKDKCFVTDFDGDGKSDLIINDAIYTEKSNIIKSWGVFKTHRVLWFRSTGSGFELYKETTYDNDDALASHYVFGDFNGDGMADMMFYGYDCLNGGTNQNWRIYTNETYTNQSGKITGITDGLNNKTQLLYAPLTDATVYQKQSNATYPVVDVQVALPVVKQMTTNQGTNAQNVVNYTYQGAKMHLQGRGLLGFAQMQVNNSTQGVTATTTSGYNTTYYNPYVLQQTVSMGGNLVSTTNFTNAVHSFGGKRIFPYISQTVQTDNLKGVTTTKNDVVDANGNTTSETVGYGNDVTTATNYTYTYVNGNGSTPNKISSVTQTTTYAGQDPYTTKQEFGYNNKGILAQQTDLANLSDSLKILTKYSNFTSLSLPKTKTVKYGNTSDLTTQYTYDNFGRLLSKKDPLGLIQSYTYNADGTVSSSTNTLGKTTSYAYNKWGQRIKNTSPTGVVEQNSLQWTSDNNALYKSITTKTNEPQVTIYYDYLGRDIHTETQNISGTIYLDKAYDNKGRLVSESKPHFSSGSSILTTYTYDTYGRKISVNDNGRTSTYAYSGLVTTATNPAGQSTQQTQNAKGDVVETIDAAGNKVCYAYNSMSKPVKVEAAGSTTQMTYDAAGRQLTLKDADAGTTTYQYNAAGQITKQTDARGKVSTVAYDKYGRITKKADNDQTISYAYYSNGLLQSETSANNTKTYTYDTYGQKTNEADVIDGVSYPFTYAYDIYGHVTQKKYPSGYSLNYGYTLGELTSIRNAGGYPIWTLNTENALGQFTGYSWGNGIKSTNTYNDEGYLTAQASWVLQDMQYNFDPTTGNLLNRKNLLKRGLSENFTYDNLNRLTSVAMNGNNATIGYANNGNITSKTDAGTYAYDDVSHPHAVTDITDNPNTISSLTQNITYNSQGKIVTIKENNKGLNIVYGVGGQRIEGLWYKDTTFTKLNQKRIYLGDYEIHIDSANNKKEIHYIAAPTGLVAVVIKQNGKDSLYYTCTDHLGSLTVMTDSVGKALEYYSYDAWGRQRSNNDWTIYTGKSGRLDRAYEYTGHETLPEFGLINMNGRVYDPILGRFLSPDNYVQSPLYSQNYNRYAYCVNNPLVYKDPSGDFFWIPVLVAAAIGGSINLGIQAANHNVKNFGDGLAAFGIGAAAGAAGGIAGQMVAGSIGFSGFFGGALKAAVGGFTGGFVGGTLDARYSGASFQLALKQGIFCGEFGALTGGVIGGVSGGIEALSNDASFWDGSANLDLSKGYGAHGISDRLQTVKGYYKGKFEGVRVFESKQLGAYEESANGFSGGITLPGRGITVGQGVFSKAYDIQLMEHEYGHILQANDIGLLNFYAKIAPASLASATLHSTVEGHNSFWTETWANYLSNEYLYHQAIANGIDSYTWDVARFPIKNISPLFHEFLLNVP